MRNLTRIASASLRGQSGAGLLATVAALAGVVVLVQATVYYNARTGAKFISKERAKILAMQAAEAGVEQNVADLGSRSFHISAGLNEYPTYQAHAIGSGSFTTRLTTVGMGAAADTIDLTSTGAAAGGSAVVKARLRLKTYVDTTLTPVALFDFDTSYSFVTTTVFDTSITMNTKDPSSMPSLNTTPAYDACMSSASKKCDVCHLPGGDVTKANVKSISKSAVDTHLGCHGDYVTTDHTCDLYKPFPDTTITSSTILDTLMNITDNTVYDTTVSVDTLVKVRFLSWK